MQPPLRAKENVLLTASGKIFICRTVPSKFGNIQPPNTTSPSYVSSRSRYRHPFHRLIPGCPVLQTFSDSAGSDGRGLGLGQRQSEADGCYFSSAPPLILTCRVSHMKPPRDSWVWTSAICDLWVVSGSFFPTASDSSLPTPASWHDIHTSSLNPPSCVKEPRNFWTSTRQTVSNNTSGWATFSPGDRNRFKVIDVEEPQRDTAVPHTNPKQ